MGLFMILATFPIHANQASRSRGWFGDVGLEGYYYHYQEKDRNDNFLRNHKGRMYGYFVHLGYQPECMDLRFALDGWCARGRNIHYDSRTTGTYDKSNHKMVELRLLGYYPWHFAPEWTLEGYTGLGNRHLIYDDSDIISSTGHKGYFRSSIYAYVPIGIRAIKEYMDMQIVGHLEYNWLQKGRQVTIGDSLLCALNYQRKGFGLRAGLDLYIPSCSNTIHYLIGGFIRYWNIGDSDIDNVYYRRTYYVPRNTTLEIGLRVGVGF